MQAMTENTSTGRLPDFLIVGTMKAGTTSLAAWLRAHPAVWSPSRKELHFFNHLWDRGVDWYREQFEDAPAGAVAGEAGPGYMIHKVYIERMAAVVPDARLLVVLRNPTDRAWSQYWHSVARDEESRSFAEVVDFELAADLTEWRASGGCVARGLYINQLRCLTAYFDRAHIHVGLFDDLAELPHPFFASVCRFLGVDDRVIPEEVGRTFDAFAIDLKLGNREPATSRRGGGLLRRVLPPRQNRSPAPPDSARPREGMPSSVRTTLQEYFRPYNDELAQWLGVDLSRWNG
jgi:hypothetical protein